MNVDLNRFLKWDLSITIGGKTYTIKPMTLADFAAVQEFDRGGNKTLGDFAEFGSQFIVERVDPPLSAIEWGAIIVAISTYALERGGKNFKATASKISEAVAAQAGIEAGLTSLGNSTAQ